MRIRILGRVKRGVREWMKVSENLNLNGDSGIVAVGEEMMGLVRKGMGTVLNDAVVLIRGFLYALFCFLVDERLYLLDHEFLLQMVSIQWLDNRLHTRFRYRMCS